MITDDELTADLTRALRADTDGLTYAGSVPRAHRPVLVTAVPLAATAATVGVLGWTALSGGTAPTTSTPGTAIGTATPSPTTSLAEPELVTERIELAGMTFNYTHRADEPSFNGECPPDYVPSGDPKTRPCYLWITSVREQVPAGAEEFQADGTTVWVATDPELDMSGLYVEAPDGEIFGIFSQARTLDQMRELAQSIDLV